jgi:hypothetical protein
MTYKSNLIKYDHVYDAVENIQLDMAKTLDYYIVNNYAKTNSDH